MCFKHNIIKIHILEYQLKSKQYIKTLSKVKIFIFFLNFKQTRIYNVYYIYHIPNILTFSNFGSCNLLIFLNYKLMLSTLIIKYIATTIDGRTLVTHSNYSCDSLVTMFNIYYYYYNLY